MKTETRTITFGAAAIAVVASFLAGAYMADGYRTPPARTFGVSDAVAAPEAIPGPKATSAPAAKIVELLETQLKAVKVAVASEREFPIEKSAVGSIDFNGEMLTQVFAPYQGRIVELFAKVGDEVKKGQALFTIDSPDLVQASSTLISSAAVLELTTRNLERMRMLYEARAAAQKDLEHATSDNRTAQGAYGAARDAARLFGKTDAEMDRIVQERRVDPILVVPSPISGRTIARNASPGLLVQPGNAPAPFVVADVSTMWMLANAAESDSPPSRSDRTSRSPLWLIRAACSRAGFPQSGRRSIRSPIESWSARKLTIPSTSCDPGCLPISSSEPATRCVRSRSRWMEWCGRATEP
jgi:membrane fusion protein, heavy metal efflux system